MSRQQASRAGFILCIGFMALVSTMRLEAARQHVLQHGRQVAVHERLAAGEADQLRAVAVARDLVEIGRDLGGR